MRDNYWESKITTGRSPSARAYHVSFYDEITDTLFLHGGQADKGRSVGDFYCLNLTNWAWKRLFLVELPPSRHHHTFTETNNPSRERVIFGGTC